MSNHLFFTVFCKRYKPSSVPFVKFYTNFSNQEQQMKQDIHTDVHNYQEIKGLDRVNLFFQHKQHFCNDISEHMCMSHRIH